jgi:hypothetical protein
LIAKTEAKRNRESRKTAKYSRGSLKGACKSARAGIIQGSHPQGKGGVYLTSWAVSVLHAAVLANLAPLNVFKALDASDPRPRVTGRTDMENRLDVLEQAHGLNMERVGLWKE